MGTPKITVLMSVYNDERYVSQAIESILHQTFTDFEFIIINDGSTDSTPHILDEYAKRDNRIKVIHQDNIGLTSSLNKGLELAQGKYIARMDADDISFAYRLQKQCEILDEHSDIGVVGSWAEIIDEDGNTLYKHCPNTNPYIIRWRLLFGNCLLHSTVMFRKDIVIEMSGYPTDCLIAQDYDLWSRLAFKTLFYQLPDILVKYRVNKKAISLKHYDKQAETSIRVVQRNIRDFFNMDVSMDVAKSLCDSENVRALPVRSGKTVLEAVNLWLKFREIFIANYDLSDAVLQKTNLEIKKDVVKKILALSRANAGYYPRQSLYALMRAFFIRPDIIFNSYLWLALIKAVLGQKLVALIKKWKEKNKELG